MYTTFASNDTTDPAFWSRKLNKEGVTSSFLRPQSGQKSGILERGFWPGDRATFMPGKKRSHFLGQDPSTTTETSPGISDSVWLYFKPMIPWLVLFSFGSWYFGWREGKFYQKGVSKLGSISQGISSSLGSGINSIKSGIGSLKSKMGLTKKRKRLNYH